MSAMPMVLDTNILLGALLMSRSLHAQVLERALSLGPVLSSGALERELRLVLERPEFDRYALPAERQARAEALLARLTPVAAPGVVKACADPKDDFVLDLALAGEAGTILSEDRDLWQMRHFRGIPIWRPGPWYWKGRS